MYKVSIIIPVYNAQKKISKAINSILNQTMDTQNIEAIFVDDCSKDKSAEIIRNYCECYPNFKLIQLDQNSGSPSRPRNIGVRAASADYIIFLDSDDRLLENSCHLLYSEASRYNYDIVRGYLKIVKSHNESRYSNRLAKKDYAVSIQELVKNLISKQSTTIDGIFNKKYLIENDITFSESIRMGEDTLFFGKCYANTDRIKYIDECVYEYVKRDEVTNVSSTQSYGSRELNDHLFVWNETRSILKNIGLDYFSLRLHVGLRSALESILNFSNGLIPPEDFNKLRSFLKENKSILSVMNLNERLNEITANILDGDYDLFVQNTKKRILINGYDLKFIKPLIPHLKQKYEVEIDEWKGHEIHDEVRSKELLKWADIIICEWLLGNAEWYSNHKRPNQLLFVRMHGFESTRQYGKRVNIDNVDSFIAVGMYYYELFIQTFKLPREKVRLIPNYVDCDRFDNQKKEGFSHNIAIIGALPSQKGLDLAVEILGKLLENDDRYQLHVIGSKPEDVKWLWKIEEERSYYEGIYKKIDENKMLKGAVKFVGWQDSAEYLREIGFILSLSKHESFHLAPGEGMASGAIGLLLKWPGVEYIYPDEFTLGSVDEIVEAIKDLENTEKFNDLSQRGKQFIRTTYDIPEVVEKFELLIQKGFLQRN
ncbi:glycosyltransferase involved in cell wall biosynthesis [Paenibacillus taihuensis]|uniref:Glycosyltransferase involved in cell wall biosynthesis n=1 Tax=Paenibacillus taihuensis TaxID=1156355 RepID=A0A3D9SB60_9BACL|nr:glycosyltransferase [Paenibacillus taihuensis]REE90520.1 glycosyltransferase involved in cell wall biosynthesis [Paenibacillus taihuensis]